MTDLERTLREMADGFERLAGEPRPTLYRVIAEHGHDYASAELTDDERAIVLGAVDRSRCGLAVKQCFSNSIRVMLADHTGSLNYVEGYVASVIPILHAWLEINGKLVDLTLRRSYQKPVRVRGQRLSNRMLGTFDPPHEYRGIVFTRKEVMRKTLASGYYGSILDDWERGFPMARAIMGGTR